MQLQIKNQQGESLDTKIDGNEESGKIAIFVHGFGSLKDERGLFTDIISVISNKYLTISFDASGWGQSEGKQEESSFVKHGQDLGSVINWATTQYPNHELNIIAHSGGVHATLSLNPVNIHKAVFSALSHSNGWVTLAYLEKRLLEKGGTLNPEGISIFPRSDGTQSKLGPTFWSCLKDLDTISILHNFAKNVQVLAIHPQSDEIVSTKSVQAYRQLKNIQYLELPGNHAYTNRKDRSYLTKVIKTFLT